MSMGRMCGMIAVGVLLCGAAVGCGGQESQLRPAGLEAMIDSLLPRIAAVSGLEVRRPVQFALQARAEARAFVEAQLREEYGPGELEGMERAYRAFGLLPDTLDLRALLLDLYEEQIVGYYDPRTDRLYVVEGVERDAAAPAVAHELVHALQDQLVPLDSLVARERGNDRGMAAQAAAEGQATIVMLVLQAEETTGRTLDPGQLPDLGALLGPAAAAQNEQFPVFSGAPRIVRETMLFPYVGGADFVQALHRATPGDEPVVPFGPNLPQSTEQVMNPQERFIRDRDEPTELRLGDPHEGWSIVYENTLGQLELSILLAEHLSTDEASAAEGWDGDRFALLDGPGAAEALVHYTVWDDERAADRYADAYRRLLEARPGRAGRVERMQVEGRPVVRVLEGEAGADLADVPIPDIQSLRAVEAP